MPNQHYNANTFRAQVSVDYLLRRAHTLMLEAIEPLLTAHELSFVQYIMLMALRDGIAVNPKDICEHLRHDGGALTRVIDQLAERGLLERSRRDRDRRKVELHITATGRQLLEKGIPSVVDKLNDAVSEFSHEEMHDLERLLGKLDTRLKSMVDSEPAEKAVA